MIDTLKLTLSDYEISKNTKLKVQPASLELDTGIEHGSYNLFRTVDLDSNEEMIKGNKAFYNDDNMQVTIKSVHQNNIGCFVQFSIPKIYSKGKNNYYPVEKGKERTIVHYIEENLKNIGIRCNIENAKLSRLDTFKNVVCDDIFDEYAKVFDLLNISRKHKRDYGTTFLYANTLEEICVYNKNFEMKQKKVSNLESFPKNTIRFENRLLKLKKIRSSIEIETIKDLFSNYENVQNHFNNSMKTSLFKYEVPEIEHISFNQVIQEMSYFESKYKRNWLQYYLSAKGLQYIIYKTGKNTFLKAIEEFTQDVNYEQRKKKISRIKKQINEVESDLVLLNEATGKSISDLYNELKSKLQIY